MEYSRRKTLPVVLEPEEVHKILEIPNTRYLISLRNKAIISLMVNCGLRVSEVSNLKPGDLNLSKGNLRVTNGKGGVDRDIPIPEATVNILKDWKKRKPDSDYFFSTVRDNKSGGTYTMKQKSKTWTIKYSSSRGSKLSVRSIQSMIKNIASRAGLKKNISPHTLRHTFGTEFYRSTRNIEALRMALGHSSITTTQIYITLANIDVVNGMKKFREFV